MIPNNQLFIKLHSLVEDFRNNFLKEYREDLVEYYDKINKDHTIRSISDQMSEGWKNARLNGIRFYDNTDEYKRLNKIMDILWWFKYSDINTLIDNQVEKAEKNLINKEYKLVERLEKKGFTDNFDIKINCYDPNLQGIITEGGKSVKFWTIIAGGAIQSMHYRYLLK